MVTVLAAEEEGDEDKLATPVAAAGGCAQPSANSVRHSFVNPWVGIVLGQDFWLRLHAAGQDRGKEQCGQVTTERLENEGGKKALA
ncbi:hypothetical protein BaRGS_00030799 [Batillaria attramentaria]|uniref:Uncharacterized protein n=1 Tax=Batillaria attramentaria TaxID=370345 RepID=A0ABD0JTK2_9CAEN